MLFKLIIEDDEGHTTVVPLVKEEITIGRKDGNTIRLTERNVSRHHARLTRANGSVFIEDLDSYNGVKVNGDRITARTTVREGDLVEIGDYHLAVQQAVEEELPPPVPAAAPEKAEPPPLPEPLVTVHAPHPPAPPADEPPIPVEAPPEAVVETEPPPPAEGAPRVREILEKDAGRLVVINTELAGDSFALVRTEMVIGRTEDADLVVPHRSVSSRHAKLVFDGGIYRILDLDSANGVLVNGEEYSRVDLRRGDIVELGHVRLRYVAPGEEYQFSGVEAVSEGKRTLVDAAVAERKQSEGGGGKRWGWVLGILVAVAIAAAGVYFLVTPAGDQIPRVDKAVDTGVLPDAGPIEQGELQERYQAALARFKQNDFEGAASGFKAVLDGNPNYQDAQAMLGKAQQELQNAKLWAQANEEMTKSNPGRAMELIDQISKVTVLEKEIAQLRPTLRRNFISFHLNKAQRSRDQGLPEEARRHLNAVAKVDANAIPIDLKQSVERMLQAKPKPENGAREPAPKEPAPKKPVVSRQQKVSEAKDLVSQGVQLVKEGKPAEAVTLFLKAKELDPSNCAVYKNLGIAYANLSNGPRQIYYYQKFLDVCPNDPMAPKVRDILSRMPATKAP